MRAERSQFKSKLEQFLKVFDFWIFLPILLITILGLFVLNHVLSLGYGSGAYPSNIIKQVLAAVAGCILIVFICLLELPTLRLITYFIYGLSIILLLYVKLDSYSLADITGADSWIQLPFIGSFQPSELAKLGIAMMAALYFEKLKLQELDLKKASLYLAIIYLLPLALILTEPDFGTAFVIVFMFVCTLFVYGIKWRYVIISAILALISLPLIWVFYLGTYQQNRILSFLFPGHDASSSYHVTQSIKAITSGGLLGNQEGIDIMVPVKESDFIYSALSERLGLLGTTLLIVLIIFFIVRSLNLAAKIASYSYFASYIIVALLAAISFHFIENMGMNVGLLPITGIPLPFMSSGGSSMLVNFMAIGFILNLSMNFKLDQSGDYS